LGKTAEVDSGGGSITGKSNARAAGEGGGE